MTQPWEAAVGGGKEEEPLLPLADHPPDSPDERERDHSTDQSRAIFLTYAPKLVMAKSLYRASNSDNKSSSDPRSIHSGKTHIHENVKV